MGQQKQQTSANDTNNASNKPLIFAKKTKLLKNNVPMHQRAVTSIPRKKKKAENKRNSMTPTSSILKKRNSASSYNDNVDQQDENAIFGTKKKRESAVSLKRKEMARMQREMKTGKIENISDENKSNNAMESKADDDEKEDDMFSFLDRSEDAKKHKAKMNATTPT